MGNKELLTSAQAAERLELRQSTFHRRVQTGKIPYVYRLPAKKKAAGYLFDAAVIDGIKEQAQ